MKKLIFPLFLLAFYSSGLQANGPEILEPDAGKQIVSRIKDLQVTAMLEETAEFKKCRDDSAYKAGASETARTESIKAAEKCFKEKLTENNDGKKLQGLSNKLNLQHYGLVPSQNVKDIQKYLTNKMIESLTGVNPANQSAEEFKENLKFGKKKLVDQKLFIDMYKTQLGKNALHEVSRFCFENLRVADGGDDINSFGEYWSKNFDKLTLANVNDLGQPQFGKDLASSENKEKVFKDIFASIQGSDGQSLLDENKMSEFFMTCGQLITPLCLEFQKSIDKDIKSQVDAGKNGVTKGSAACLARGRIQSYRKAIARAEQVAEQFNQMQIEDQKSLIIGLDKGSDPARFFGDDPSDPSLDDLTNHASADFISGGYTKDQNFDLKAKECSTNPELDKCEAFISDGDDLDKAKHTVEMEMTLKKEVEMARVRKLKTDNDKSLDEYLKENGFFDLIGQEHTPDSLANAVGESFEAKKIATLEKINAKMGSRQVKKDSTITKDQVDSVIKDTKEERARMAQVILFNNIITSRLTLNKRDASGKEEAVGRNVNAWLKEEEALKGASVDTKLFENLQTTDTGLGRESQIAGFEILDKFLGDKSRPESD